MEFPIADEFYMFNRSVRGTHHVVATLDENTPGFVPGNLAMGQDHPVAWCRDYDGGRVFATSLGHYGNLYTPVAGQPSNLVKLLTGGVRWAAGLAGNDNDCRATVWSNFRRTTLATDLNGPVSLDIASDGRVYWTEIGAPGHTSSGRVRMLNPETGEKALVATIPTRADALGASEDGVLGMSLDPNFDTNRFIYVYYSPRGDGLNWPNAGAGMVLGHNVVSRFELNAAGTAVVDEQEIIRVPKVKVAPDGDGGPQGATTNWPAHTGGAGMDFDAQGNLYLGVGDDVNPYDANRNWTPIDQRYEHRYDARNTAANTNDLRGKILRIKPRANADGAPGVGTTYDIPAGQHVPGRDGEDEARDLRDGLPQPVHRARGPEAPRRGRGRRVRARLGHQQRDARPRGHHRVEPHHQARLPRLAVLHGRQLAGQHVLPLPVPERPDRRPLRLLGRRRSRTSRRTTPAWPTCPARPSPPRSGTSATAPPRRGSASRPRPARRSRTPARSTATTRTTSPRPSGRPTSTAAGSSTTAR